MIFRFLFFTFTASLLAHMEFVTPYHRRSKFSPYYQQTNNVDYDGLNPLGSKAGFTYPFPCKGHAKGPVQASYQAGSSIAVALTGSAKHNGGHCQFALSYDDKKFVVLKDVFTNCIIDSVNYSIPLPGNIPPSKNATLVWGWINAVGNREWYMNCIDIEITGGTSGGKLTGKEMLVANLPGYPVFEEFSIAGPQLEKFNSRNTISIP
ncbi:hypothetical protein K502DRAFT_116942 [Neoconidiobolus thromboides FSU 785]|nr:hypothetical protein K502DRAFT_116942 [Neoconidiobolus thromboides FSU 785]